MLPGQTLDDIEYFGARPLPARKLHVLVVLPEANDEDADDDELSSEEEDLLTTTRKYVHQQVSSQEGREILAFLNIRVEAVPAVPIVCRDTTHTPDYFQWSPVAGGSCTEAALDTYQDRICFQTYMERHLRRVLETEKLMVAAVPEDSAILTVGIGDIEFYGRPDLLVLSTAVQNDLSTMQNLPDVRVLVNVKQALDAGADFQALAALIALDLRAKTPVMALLTDLNGAWRFFYVGEGDTEDTVIHKMTYTTSAEAFALLRSVLTQPRALGHQSTELPEDERVLQLCKLNSLRQVAGSGGLRDLIEHNYYY